MGEFILVSRTMIMLITATLEEDFERVNQT